MSDFGWALLLIAIFALVVSIGSPKYNAWVDRHNNKRKAQNGDDRRHLPHTH